MKTFCLINVDKVFFEYYYVFIHNFSLSDSYKSKFNLKGVGRMNVIYNIKDEATFDNMATELEEMTEQEKQAFLMLLQGYQAGIRVGLQIAKGHEEEPA